MTLSRAFGGEAPNRPHLVTDGKRGVAGEVGDLRSDLELAFSRIEERDGYPRVSRLVGGNIVALSELPEAHSLVGTDLLQSQTKATLVIGASTAALTFTANRPGTPGNSITVAIVDTSSGNLAVTESGGDIEIDFGGDTPDADTVKAAADAVAGVARLVQIVSGGAGLPAVTAQANLASGVGDGLLVFVNGIAQEIRGAATDTAIPLEITTMTGAIHDDMASLQVLSDGVYSDALTLRVLGAIGALTRITGGCTTVSISGMPISKPLVGTELLGGQSSATLTFGASTAQLDFDANRPGTPGNSITVEIVDTSSGNLAVTVSGTDIEIDFGGDTPTADQVKTALDADLEILDLITTTSGGGGNPAVTGVENLAGGLGAGFSVTVNGLEQRLVTPVTDTAVPLSIYVLTGAANLDQAKLLLVSNGAPVGEGQLPIVT